MNECPPQQRDHFNKKWIIFIQPLEFSGEQGIFVTVLGSFWDDPCNMVQLNFLTPGKGDSFWVSIMFSWTIRQSLGVLGVWISLCVVLFLWGGKHHRCCRVVLLVVFFFWWPRWLESDLFPLKLAELFFFNWLGVQQHQQKSEKNMMQRNGC